MMQVTVQSILRFCLLFFTLFALACSLPSPGEVRLKGLLANDTELSLEETEKAACDALVAAGFRQIHVQPGAGQSHLKRVLAKRPSSAVNPLGLEAFIDFYSKSGDLIETYVHVTGSSMVILDSIREDLLNKLNGQIRLAEDRKRLGRAEKERERKIHEKELPPFTGQRHALIVGISVYQDSNFTGLLRARADAEALAEFLKSSDGGNIASDRIHILIDSKAIRREIIDGLVKVGKQTRPGDLILFYFAGHGRAPGGKGTGRYLVPYDGNYRKPEATLIENKELAERLSQANAKRQIVFLDCCFADFVPVRSAMEDQPFEPLVGKFRAILTSTKGNETALDRIGTDDSNGPFAAAILEALRSDVPADKDEDGLLSVEELYDHVYSDVTKRASSVGHKMTPQLYGSEESKSIEVIRLRNFEKSR